MGIIEESVYYIKNQLLKTKREGIKDLTCHMADIGFSTAPCSGSNHLCVESGLIVHTANVMRLADKIAKTVLPADQYKELKQSVIICAALHDLGKCGQFGKPYYVENMVKDGRPTKANPEQKYKRSDSKPFEQNKELLHVDHNIRSVIEATLYIELTEEEQFAILYHDGLYGSMKYEIIGKERPLQMILHFADFWVSHFDEGKDLPEEGEVNKNGNDNSTEQCDSTTE